jgi:hypothetical protein
MNIELFISGVTEKNKHLKMQKAVRILSRQLGVPVVPRERHEHDGKEPFIFRAHEGLIYRWYNFFSAAMDETYNFVLSYFGLPDVRIISKAGELRHRGKIIYSPETGEPIKESEWDSFVKLLENFLNRKLKGTDKRIILDSKALGHILDRMLKYNKYDEVTALPLENVKYHGKTLDWISDSVKNMRTALGEGLSRSEMARIQILQLSAAQRITGVSDKIKSDIKQILIDGVIARKSKSQISQEIFYKMTGHNRDFQKIADTEIQNSINNAFLLDEVHNAEPGEKIYFQRVEVLDQNTCPFCRKMNGKIVLWSDTPLVNDKIDDPVADFAIWDGKNWDGKKEFVANGAFHPYCRGIWVRYNSTVDALVAHLQNHSELYNKALDKARAEFKARGIENPNDKTPGFINRVNELYAGEDIVEKSLTWSGYELQDRYKFAGFNISVENKAGSVRSGKDKDGHEWHSNMYFDYGYIRGSEGLDGDHFDCYIGPNEEAENVYIVNQQDPITKKFDEQKAMVGFNSIQEAKAAYLKQYNRPGFLRDIITMPLEEFRQKILSKRYHGKIVKSEYEISNSMKKSYTDKVREALEREL